MWRVIYPSANSMPCPLIIPRLAECERNVSIFDHVLYLSPHCTGMNCQRSPIYIPTTIYPPPPCSISTHSLPTPPTLPAKMKENKSQLTSQPKQHQEINHQHRPEHRHIKDLPPRTAKRNRHRAGTRMPELELRQPAYKGSEFFVLFGRQGGTTVFEVFVLG